MLLLCYSRLSGGSTQSEVIPSNLEKKKKKSLFGKLKKLTKSSRSMDQESNEYVLGSGSQVITNAWFRFNEDYYC